MNRETFTITESKEGIDLCDLQPGSVVDVETAGHHYRIEYLGRDDVQISGHPTLCPTAVPAHLKGSFGTDGGFQPGFIGLGRRMAFRRENDKFGVVTSAVTGVRQKQ